MEEISPVIVIGDTHGCYKTLLALIKKFPEKSRICLVGDLIDRGPMSKEILEYVIKNRIDCVKGNHEQMMETGNEGYLWTKNGGDITLSQYKDDGELFLKHKNWIKTLPTYKKYPEVKNKDGRYLIVSHSAITSKELELISASGEIFWNRGRPIDNKEWFNIFGHTPGNSVFICDYYANVDTGCFYKKSALGTLSAIQFPEMKIYTQENIDF